MSEIREMLNLVWAAAEQRVIVNIMLYFATGVLFLMVAGASALFSKRLYVTEEEDDSSRHKDHSVSDALLIGAIVCVGLAVVTVAWAVADAMSIQYNTLAIMMSLINSALD